MSKDRPILVVLEDKNGKDDITIYPEIHHVYSDDNFSAAIDLENQQPGDVSILVDIDETGSRILNCQSISPSFQVLSAQLRAQSLSGGEPAHLLSIEGITDGSNSHNDDDTHRPTESNDLYKMIAQASQMLARIKEQNSQLAEITER